MKKDLTTRAKVTLVAGLAAIITGCDGGGSGGVESTRVTIYTGIDAQSREISEDLLFNPTEYTSFTYNGATGFTDINAEEMGTIWFTTPEAAILYNTPVVDPRPDRPSNPGNDSDDSGSNDDSDDSGGSGDNGGSDGPIHGGDI
jgi:hypothetical protein